MTIDLSGQSDGFTITGSAFNDVITGSSGDDTIVGFAGADNVNGGGGTDTILLDATSTDLNSAPNNRIVNVEAISAAAAAAGVTIALGGQTEGFTITGSAFADTITGSTGNDTINAGAGDDTINEFVGADTVDGGDGTDTIALTTTSADLNSASDAQIVNVEDVSAAGAGSGVTIDLSAQSEGFTITGSAFADHITGGSGDDTIVGFAGADTVDGGGGTDTIALTATSADLNGAGNNRIVNVEAVSAAGAAAGVTINLAGQIEGFTITGSAFADTITGGQDADTIHAGAGDDTINEFFGADSVDGGAGTDTIAVTTTWLDLNSASDAQIVNVEAVSAAGAGSGVTIDLSAQSEGFTITGSAFADHITGTSSDDTINNFVGADNVDGGDGTDTLALTADLNGAGDTQIRNIETVSAAGASAGVTIDLGGQLEGFTITGSAFADTITGGADADTIDAGAGDDIITGAVGSDAIDGGADVDTAVFTGNRADYTVSLSGSTYTVVDNRAGSPDGTDTVTNVENFQFADGTFTAAEVENDPPAGEVAVAGDATEDQVLTADTSTLADADGLGTLHYQWQRSNGSGWDDVGSDQDSYALGDADVGQQIRVVVSYTDGQGAGESVTSAADVGGRQCQRRADRRRSASPARSPRTRP